MSLIPRDYLNSVVAIGVDNSINSSSQEKQWIATGFLVSMSEPNNINDSTVYLVTNKHVFNNRKLVYIRFNSVNGDFVRDYQVNLVDNYGNKIYTEHPNNDVDIVAMQINPLKLIGDSAVWSAFDLNNNALDLIKMNNTGVDEGSMVYSLGFPMNLVGVYKTPICRYGCISRISDAFLRPNKAYFYLVDVHSFPGNSGGPIINKAENVSVNNTPYNPTTNLIGILSANIQYKDVLVSQQTQEIRMVQTENSGLTVVHPVDKIREVVLLDWDRHRLHTNDFQKTNDEKDR